MRHNDVEIVKSDISNPHQLRDAVMCVFHQIIQKGFDGRLWSFFNHLRCVPFSYRYRTVDRRWKEMKAIEAAADKALQALWEYDEAIRALEIRMGLIKPEKTDKPAPVSE